VLRPIGVVLEVTSDPPGAQIRNATNKVVGSTGADGSGQIALQPGSHDLKAFFGDLEPVTMHVDVKLTQTKKLDRFNFNYGTLLFGEVQPPDARTNAVVLRADQNRVEFGSVIYLRPKEAYSYRIEARGYQPYQTNVTVSKGEKLSIANVILDRLRVPIKVVTDPPGLEITYNGMRLANAGPDVPLPWGPAELVARHPRLGSITNTLDIKFDAPNSMPEFKFEYADLVATNLPDDVVVKEGGITVPFVPRGSQKVAFEKPGVHVYELLWDNKRIDTVTNTVGRGLNAILHSELLGFEWENGIGMRLVKVAGLLGPGRDGWVGKFEVTRGQFQKVMGTSDASANKGPDWPIDNVSWVQATNFCEKLTRMDTRPPLGYAGRYALPTLDQWRTFAAGAELNAKNAVYGTTNAAPVGSREQANRFRVHDVLGNVKEWLQGNDPKDKDVIGGSFRSRPSFGGMGAFTNTQSFQLDQLSEDLGFRVILVPSQ
jgi:hypothetical protein